jgi:hypothetical protein
VGFWGVCCFALATVMAFGSVGIFAGRGEGSAGRGEVGGSARNRARGVSSWVVTTAGVAVDCISKVEVGGLLVEDLNVVSKQIFRRKWYISYAFRHVGNADRPGRRGNMESPVQLGKRSGIRTKRLLTFSRDSLVDKMDGRRERKAL